MVPSRWRRLWLCLTPATVSLSLPNRVAGLGNNLTEREDVITDLKMWTLLSGHYSLSDSSPFSSCIHPTCSFLHEYVNSPLELEKSHGARVHGAYAKSKNVRIWGEPGPGTMFTYPDWQKAGRLEGICRSSLY